MHWFSRASIAVVGNFIWLVVVFLAIYPAIEFLRIGPIIGSIIILSCWAVHFIIPVAIYGWLTRYYHPKRQFFDGETRCRKCGYILKGIREPICSECGERI